MYITKTAVNRKELFSFVVFRFAKELYIITKFVIKDIYSFGLLNK